MPLSFLFPYHFQIKIEIWILFQEKQKTDN